jgi:sorbitol-6-phosphate 2-dehydrogenase
VGIDEATKVAEFIKRKYKVRTLALKLDVIKKEQIDEFILTVIAKFKKIYILIHSAAIVNVMDFLEIKEREWDHVLNNEYKKKKIF